MKPVRKIPLFVLIAIILFITVVSAHPGSLDANGGHWNRSTGEYHFHDGSSSSGGSSYNSNYSYPDFTPPYEPPEETPYRSNKQVDAPSSKGIGSTILLVFCVLIGASFAFATIQCLFEFIYDIFMEKHLPRWKLSQYEQAINKFISCIQEMKECEITIKSQSPTYTIPQGYEIGFDDLPKIECAKHWGDIFTIYTKGFRGKKIHVKFNCSGATTKHHIYYYYKNNLADILCKRCSSKYTVPDLTWYEEYLKYQSAPKRYDSLLGHQKQLKQELLTLHKKCNSSFFNFLIFFHGKYTHKRKELNAAYSRALNLEKKPISQSKSDSYKQVSLDDLS